MEIKIWLLFLQSWYEVFNLTFYSSVEDAVFKALGVE